jgi:hypothetical protein
MHITKVGCSIKIPTQVFGNETLWVEYELQQGEDANAGLNAARQLCWKNHKLANPHLYQDQETTVSNIINAPADKKKLQPYDGIVEMINKCTELEGANGLLGYKKLSESNKHIMEAYQSKLKELTQ